MRFALNVYLYKIHQLQELKPGDNDLLERFALKFLARMEVVQNWPKSILRTDETHFNIWRTVNTHNCRIWSTDNSHQVLQMFQNSPHINAWISFTVTIVTGPFFKGNQSAEIKSQFRKCSPLSEHFTTYIQSRTRTCRCLVTIKFQQDDALPHIASEVQSLLRCHVALSIMDFLQDGLHLHPIKPREIFSSGVISKITFIKET